MQKTDELVNTLVKAVDDIQNKKAKGYDTQATVTRIEGGTAYVHIPGGVDETPAQMTITAKKGDTVRVRVANGTAWLVGNATAPPTDDAKANAAVVVANTATTMAGDAIESANIAAEAAESAKTSAGEAKASATEAKTQAINATNYANGALTQLGTVESVVDTLNWIAEHSTFVLSADASVVSGKTYYIPSNNTLTITADTQTVNGVTFTIDEALGTVTMNGTATDTTYVILGSPAITASDDAYLSGVTGGSLNTYALRYAEGGSGQFVYDGARKLQYMSSYNDVWAYVKSGATVNNVVLTPRVTIGGGDYEYQIVENPTGDPSAQGYYELNTSDAVKTYVQSHLSLTNDGLYVLKDGSGWKVLVKNNGVEIQNETGDAVADYGASVRIGLATVGHIILTSNSLEVFDGNDSVAEFGSTVRVGQEANGESRVIVSSNGMSVIAKDSNGEDYSVAEIGSSVSGNTTKRHFTLGSRVANSTIGNESCAIGWENTASGLCSFATGYSNTASGNYSQAEGELSEATSSHAHAEGYDTRATALYSHAEGIEAQANGVASHAEGTSTADGDYSHAEGADAHAEGYESHAEADATAEGDYSHAEGATTATGDYSHTSGYYTKADYDYQTAIGKYNSNKSGDLFEVGNGTSSSARTNAFEVDTSGNVNIASGAKYKINGTALAASDVGALPTRPTSIEFQPSSSSAGNGGFIDFHYNQSTADYTSRIIEAASGALTVSGSLTVGGHSSAIGTVKQAYATAKTVNNNTNTNLTSISLEAGTWVITAGVRFPSNATGLRRMNVATSSGSANADVQLMAVNGGSTQLAYTLIVSPTATTTYYLNCYQNSGSNLSLSAGGGENGLNFIRAVRIA